MLETRELTRRFGGLVAVHRVSLAVARGEVRSIIGPNGAGKTTLFNLITGALAPSEGRIFFKGGDVTGLAPPAIFRLGVVRSFQVSHLFPKLSVWQNVELMVYGRVRSSGSPFARVRESATGVKRRVTTALDRLGIGGRAEEMAGTLSHGDRRLVEIAMALAAEPEPLLLDEPTAGMSPDAARPSPDAGAARRHRGLRRHDRALGCLPPGGARRSRGAPRPERHGQDHDAAGHHGIEPGPRRTHRLQGHGRHAASALRDRAPRD